MSSMPVGTVAPAPRGAARHQSPPRPSMLVRALRRPAVTAAVGLAVVATTAAGYQASDRHQTEQAGFTVSAQAIEQANEQSDLQIENDAQLASARSDANASAAALQEKDRRDRLAAEAAAARPLGRPQSRRPREGAQGPEAKRDAIIARAKDDPRAAARVLLPEYGWDDSQFSCLDNLWEGESGWNYRAENPPPAPTASRSRCRVRRWPASPPTGARTRSPRSRGACSTSRAATAAPAVHGRQWQSRSPHWY